MKINSLIEAKAELTHGTGSYNPVVLSTRIRLARNLMDNSFPGRADASQRQEILSACMDAVGGLPRMKKGNKFLIEELSDLEKQILMERHLISRELMKRRKGAGVMISKDQDCSIMINEEDHLRIQFLRRGLNFTRTWNSINAIDDSIEETLDYAFSPDLGYLTAWPTNLGTGLRASAMMHLPGLVISSQMEKVIRAVSELGITVRGLFGEGSDASGSIFQISNQRTLGESEKEIIKRLGEVINAIVEQELNARGKLLEDEPVKLCDKISRAFGLLGNVWLLSSAEAMSFLSLMRLAIDMGILPVEQRPLIDRLFIESQPGHIQYSAQEEVSPQMRDQLRARLFREQFHDLPSLNFDKLAKL